MPDTVFSRALVVAFITSAAFISPLASGGQWGEIPSGEVGSLVNQAAPHDVARIEALQRLAAMGMEAASAGPALIKLLSDPTEVTIPDNPHVGHHTVRVADAASRALEAIGSAALPALRETMVKSAGDPAGAMAATTLERMHFLLGRNGTLHVLPVEQDDITAWINASDNQDAKIRCTAVRCLAEVKSPQAVNVFVRRTADPDVETRRQAIIGLGRLRAPEGIPQLISALESADVSRDAASALGSIGAPAVDPLVAQLRKWGSKPEDSDPATTALCSIRDHAAMAPLLAHINDTDTHVRNAVVAALGEVSNADAIEPLVRVLQSDKDSRIRSLAAGALRMMPDARVFATNSDPRAVAAVAALKKSATDDPDAEVRKIASAGVKQLDPSGK